MTNILHEIMKWCEEFELNPENLDSEVPLTDHAFDGAGQAIDFCFEEVRETERAYVTYDEVEILDGFLDLTWVALNGAYKFLRSQGQSPSEARDNVLAALKTIYNANNAKRDAYGDILYNKDGKVIKPEGWKSPNLEEYV